MGVNRVDYGDTTLIDLTSDTVNASNLLVGNTAHNSAGETVNGSCTYNCDTSSDTVGRGHVAYPYTFHDKLGYQQVGAMQKMSDSQKTMVINSVNNGGMYFGESCYTDNIAYKFEEGAVTDLIPENIKKDVTILGITGTLEGGGGCEQSIKTLWTNPSPTKSFSAQTIALDLSNYAGVIIKTKNSATATSQLNSSFIEVGSSLRIGPGYSGNSSAVSRLTTVSTTDITFDVGKNGSTINNAYLIPTEIQVISTQGDEEISTQLYEPNNPDNELS